MNSDRQTPTAVPALPRPVPEARRRCYQVGPLVLDVDACRARVDGKLLVLTLTEIRLLADLVEHPAVVRTRQDLLREIWNYKAAIVSRSPDTHIQRLRGKLGVAAALIETVRGVGYRLSAAYPVIVVA